MLVFTKYKNKCNLKFTSHNYRESESAPFALILRIRPKQFSHCLNSGNDVEMDSPATSAKCNQVLHRPGFPEFGLNSRDADNPPPSAPKESYGSRQSQHNSSRCSSSGNKGTIDSSSDSDEFSEKVIFSQDSPKVVDITTDFDWELDRFVEFKSPFTRKEILSPGNNSSHWNKNNSLV